MNVTVTVRHVPVPDAVRDAARARAEGLAKFFDNIQKAEVILDSAPDGRFTAEVVVAAPRGAVLVCSATEETLTAALDVAGDKIERQLQKYKERLRLRSGKEQERATRRYMRRLGRREMQAVQEDTSGDLWW